MTLAVQQLSRADLLNGVAFLDEIRSESTPELSSIEPVFQKGTDIEDARHVVEERLTQAHAVPKHLLLIGLALAA